MTGLMRRSKPGDGGGWRVGRLSCFAGSALAQEAKGVSPSRGGESRGRRLARDSFHARRIAVMEKLGQEETFVRARQATSSTVLAIHDGVIP
jgi:hypothetical protein